VLLDVALRHTLQIMPFNVPNLINYSNRQPKMFEFFKISPCQKFVLVKQNEGK